MKLVGCIVLLICALTGLCASTRSTLKTAKEACPKDYPCCSKYGYCGNTEEHCSLKYGCLFGCWKSNGTEPSLDKKSISRKKLLNVGQISSTATVDEKGTSRKKIYYGCLSPDHLTLTFDDGPSDYTNGILDILRDYGIKASFFVIGSNINTPAARSTIKRIVAEGHVLGSHTWSHPDLTTLNDTEIIAEMNKTAEVGVSVVFLGSWPTYMRPPYGSIDDRVRNILQKQLNYSIVMWNLDSNDWRHYRKHPTKIYASFASVLRPPTTSKKNNSLLAAENKIGRISLQHDLYEPTLQQQEDIINLIIRRNIKIVPLHVCIGEKA